MMRKTFFIAALAAVLAIGQSGAQTTSKSLISNAAQKLSLLRTDTLKPGTTTYSINGNKVAVRINSLNKLDHIGIPVFPLEMKKLNPSPVYDFIEYALLDNTFAINNKALIYNYIVFEAGSWNTLTSLPSDASCTISCTDDKMYEVAWNKDGTTLAAVKFPKMYDLLSLSNKEEIENLFIYQLQATEGKPTNHTLTTVTESTFSKEYKNDKILMRKGQEYRTKSLNSNLYYQKKGKSYSLFCQSKYPAESLANILLAADPKLPKVMVTANVVKYDGTKETVDFEIADLLQLLKSQGCQLYYGFDRLEGNTAHVNLLASNPAMGYDHVFRLQCSYAMLDESTVRLKGTINLFAPTSNVKNLFYEYKK